MKGNVSGSRFCPAFQSRQNRRYIALNTSAVQIPVPDVIFKYGRVEAVVLATPSRIDWPLPVQWYSVVCNLLPRRGSHPAAVLHGFSHLRAYPSSFTTTG